MFARSWQHHDGKQLGACRMCKTPNGLWLLHMQACSMLGRDLCRILLLAQSCRS
jgi:hypothetical protein